MTTTLSAEIISLLTLFVFIALALSVCAFVWKRMLFSIVSALAWLVCLGFGVTLDAELGTQTGLPVGTISLLFLFLFITMLASIWFLRPEKQVLPPENPHQYMLDLRAQAEEYRKLRRRAP